MNILFISKNGNSLNLAERVKLEGHNSSLYIINKNARKIGEGMISKPPYNGHILKSGGYIVSTSIDKLLKDTTPDLVVFDTYGMGRIADYVKGNGVKVLGGCRWADYVEVNREYSDTLMKQVGIIIAPKSKFSHIKVGCELWWNGLSANIYNIIFDDDRFMDGDVGVSVGCAGNIVKMISNKARVVVEGIGKMERLLKKTTYRGPLSLNFLITPSNLYGVNFVIGFRPNSTHSLLELYRGNVTKLLWLIASSGQIKGEFSSDYAIAVRLSIPPYPHTKYTEGGQLDLDVDGINMWNSKHIWLRDVYKDKTYKSAGCDGNLLSVTARGRDVMECRKRAYRTIDNLTIEDKQYRTDIGVRVDRDEKDLKRWGWF